MGAITGVASILLISITIMLGCSRVCADPDMLQDICVADLTSAVKVNGFPCKSNASADDFFTAALAKPGATNNSVGSLVTGANVLRIPGLNTLGLSFARIDFAPGGGVNPPHIHPRATEIIFVLEGTLNVGFITTANVHISKHIHKGDVFTFPKGLVHYQYNPWKDIPAAVISAFDSQLPGTQSIAVTLFGAKPPVPDIVLAKAFQVSVKDIQMVKSKFAK